MISIKDIRQARYNDTVKKDKYNNDNKHKEKK